ncbi:Transmembrane protein 79 [Varanus komodoensis]|nr:Transmembrane protein 79 [Varanus komodoensis]
MGRRVRLAATQDLLAPRKVPLQSRPSNTATEIPVPGPAWLFETQRPLHSFLENGQRTSFSLWVRFGFGCILGNHIQGVGQAGGQQVGLNLELAHREALGGQGRPCRSIAASPAFSLPCRLLYWLAYAMGRSFRGFGFGLTFLPIVTMLLFNLYSMFLLDAESMFATAGSGEAPAEKEQRAAPFKPRYWG